jgi:hypothetical protein
VSFRTSHFSSCPANIHQVAVITPDSDSQSVSSGNPGSIPGKTSSCSPLLRDSTFLPFVLAYHHKVCCLSFCVNYVLAYREWYLQAVRIPQDSSRHLIFCRERRAHASISQKGATSYLRNYTTLYHLPRVSPAKVFRATYHSMTLASEL